MTLWGITLTGCDEVEPFIDEFAQFLNAEERTHAGEHLDGERQAVDGVVQAV